MLASSAISEKRLLDEFLELIKIDSPVFEEGELAKVLESKLTQLGLTVVNDASGPTTGNLIARLPGNVNTTTTIALNAHMDTVEPGRGIKPIVQEGIVRSSGDTILGADNKASIAAILEAVRVLQESGAPRPDLELLFTFGEEFGLVGAGTLDVSQLRARLCFTLDAVGPIGTIVTCAPIHYSLKARIIGRAAHAGVVPEDGINALVAASRAIARMPLGRIDPETTANIGLMRSGSARNAVPALAELEGETRSREDSKAEAQLDTMCRILKEEVNALGATLDLETKLDYPSYRFPPESPAILTARRALERLGVPVELVPSGGGSDANKLNNKGLTTVVLGTGMVAAHTVDEHIAVSDVVLLTRVALELVSTAVEQIAAG